MPQNMDHEDLITGLQKIPEISLNDCTIFSSQTGISSAQIFS